MGCPQCQLVRINGMLCHETGCPLSHFGIVLECKECGYEFRPEKPWQAFCCDSCYRSHNNLPGDDECFDGAFARDEEDGLADFYASDE